MPYQAGSKASHHYIFHPPGSFGTCYSKINFILPDKISFQFIKQGLEKFMLDFARIDSLLDQFSFYNFQFFLCLTFQLVKS